MTSHIFVSIFSLFLPFYVKCPLLMNVDFFYVFPCLLFYLRNFILCLARYLYVYICFGDNKFCWVLQTQVYIDSSFLLCTYKPGIWFLCYIDFLMMLSDFQYPRHLVIQNFLKFNEVFSTIL